MSIQKITKDQLRRMGDQEGLILQGCGGDLQDWVDGINVMLTEDGVFKKGAGGNGGKSEESEPRKFQTQENQTRIPFPHRASRAD